MTPIDMNHLPSGRARSPGAAARIGLVRLTDAAPVIWAHETGAFAARGLDVVLSVEPSWSNIADKLTYGLLDAAVILPPLALAVSLGLRGVGTPLIVPMSLSLNGNTLTLATDIADLLISDGGGAMAVGQRLKQHLATRHRRLRLATVHVFSTHDFLVRYWLAACGIDPDRDVELSVVPPEMTAVALRAGQIDGFCAGAPWGAIASEARVGRTILATSEIWRNHPEKCLAVSRRWADGNPDLLDRMIEAVIDGARACDDPGNADDVAEILGRARYLGMVPEIIRRSLPLAEHEAPGGGGACSTFFRNAANFPWRSHADWFVAQMVRWGHLPAGAYGDAAAEIYRPDLFRSAAERLGISAPLQDRKTEGAHATAWQIPGTQLPIQMDPDSFCDGRAFDG